MLDTLRFALHNDSWRPNTRRNYRIAIDRHLVKAFGPLRLEQLSPLLVQRCLTQHRTEHGARRRITYAHTVLRSALSEARRLQLVSINAAELVTVPETDDASHCAAERRRRDAVSEGGQAASSRLVVLRGARVRSAAWRSDGAPLGRCRSGNRGDARPEGSERGRLRGLPPLRRMPSWRCPQSKTAYEERDSDCRSTRSRGCAWSNWRAWSNRPPWSCG